MKTYLIPLIISTIVLLSYFLISQTILPENSLSKQCDIPYDENFIGRDIIAGSNPEKSKFSIKGEFSIFHTVPIGEFRIDELAHSLILKPVPTSHGYIIMCDPLPNLEKRFDTKIDGLIILADNEEIEHNMINNMLRIDINNNTRIEIRGFSNV